MIESQHSSDLVQSLHERILRLELIAEITRIVSSILDLDSLLDTCVNLIRERIYYHPFLYLLDDTQKWAIIRAGTGEVGHLLLKRKHQIEVNSTTLIGWCIKNRKARMIIDDQPDADNFNNPLKVILPEFRCVVAIPLISRDKMIGAIEIHTWDENYGWGFDKYLADYQMMADHIAVAIDNARQFGEIKGKVEIAQR